MSRGTEEARAAHNAARAEPRGETLAERVAALAETWEFGDAEFGATERERNRTAALRALLAPVPAEPEVAAMCPGCSGTGRQLNLLRVGATEPCWECGAPTNTPPADNAAPEASAVETWRCVNCDADLTAHCSSCGAVQ